MIFLLLILAPVDECSSNPCENEGTCIDNLSHYTCQCADGYNGVHCQSEIDECASQPCHNGAQCDNQVNQYACTCEDGYTGINCEAEIGEYDTQPWM